MTANRRQVALYRRITVVYPRSFRTEYRDDLVGVFAAQLDEESATRVWGRTVRDLVTTVPSQHLEAHMHRRSTNAPALICGAVALTALLLAAMFGTSPVSILLLGVVLVASVVAALTRRAGRPVSEGHAARRWWQFLAVGGGLLLIMIAVENSPLRTGENAADGRWYVSFFAFVFSVVLIVTGLILSISRAFDRRTSNL